MLYDANKIFIEETRIVWNLSFAGIFTQWPNTQSETPNRKNDSAEIKWGQISKDFIGSPCPMKIGMM